MDRMDISHKFIEREEDKMYKL